LSITYITRNGESIIFEVIKVNIGERAFNMLVRMQNISAGNNPSRISVLMNCSSMAEIVYSYLQDTHSKIFQRLTNIYYSKFNQEFSPGWLKLYHETCGHMNLYIENLLGMETGLTNGIKIFSGRDREDMLRSAEVADVGFVDNNSIYFNSSSVAVGGRRAEYYRMSKKSKLRKFNNLQYDIEIKI
jgi:hypothetical protein